MEDVADRVNLKDVVARAATVADLDAADRLADDRADYLAFVASLSADELAVWERMGRHE